MKRFFLKTFDAFLTLFLVTTITFCLLRILPGGPFDEEVALPPEVKQKLIEKFLLHESIFNQYVHYLRNLMNFDLGTSFVISQVPVVEIISESMGPSILLGGSALMICLAVGTILGLLGGLTEGKPLDRGIQFFVGLIMSLPSFLSGPILVLIFSVWLDLLPPALWNGPSYVVLPIITLSLRPIALVSRLVRSSTIDTCQDPFVLAAFAKGLPPARVYGIHVLRNSLLPVAGLIPPMAANLLSGSFVTEAIFAIPGLGRYLVDSVVNRDFPLVMGLTLFYSCLLILAHWINNVFILFLDPRSQTEQT